MKISMSVVEITPAMAQDILDSSNVNNRVVSKARVNKYAGLMTEGKWMTTHQGICISDKGRLIDGQHRLLAIIKSNKTIDLCLTTGIKDEAFGEIDIPGGHRDAGDRLGIDKRVAAIITRACSINKDKWSSPTLDELKLMYSKIGEKAEKLIAEHGASSVYFSTAEIKLAAVLCAINDENDQYAFGLYGALVRSDIESLNGIGSKWMKMHIVGQTKKLSQEENLSLGCFAFSKQNSGRRKFDNVDSKSFARKVLSDLRGINGTAH